MRRRDFLRAAAAQVAAATLAGCTRLLGRKTAKKPAESDPTAPESLFSPESRKVLLGVADVIVPRDGEHPAASEIDLVPRLERRVLASEGRLLLHRMNWWRFEGAIRQRVSFTDGRPDPQALAPILEGWYAAFRSERRPSAEARFFEALRRDVLRIYYSSPAGWASVGYAGPVHRSHPLGEGHE